jgi:imidazolonepropionase
VTPHPTADLLIEGAAEIVTCADGQLGIVRDGAIACRDGFVVAVGPRADVLREVDVEGAIRLDAARGVVIPGMIDTHAHVVFGGDRIDDFAARSRGDQTRGAGGSASGIQATAAATADTSDDDLVASAAPRVLELYRCGTTTIESKTGYGLTASSEERMLTVNRELDARGPAAIVSTLFASHTFPDGRSRSAWVDEIVAEVIPRAAEVGFCHFNDVYCGSSYFSVEESRRVLEAGRSHGLRPKLHFDAYAENLPGVADLAAEMACACVYHLNHASDRDIALLVASGCVGVMTPVVDLTKPTSDRVDARRLRAAGMDVALATDYGPGCPMPNLQSVIALACKVSHLSVEDAILGVTIHAARAAGIESQAGSIAIGKRADILVLNHERYESLGHGFGTNAAREIVRGGVWDRAFESEGYRSSANVPDAT